jgi:hypothetical protein
MKIGDIKNLLLALEDKFPAAPGKRHFITWDSNKKSVALGLWYEPSKFIDILISDDEDISIVDTVVSSIASLVESHKAALALKIKPEVSNPNPPAQA